MNPGPRRRWAAETAGTALLVGIGTGAIVGAGRVGGIPQWAMALAWFAAVLVPIVLFARISGAHLNPAVTLALAASRRFPWKQVPGYLASQLVGAFSASGVVLATLGSGEHLGATVPVGGSVLSGFTGEAAFTMLLVGSVLVLVDRGEGWHRWRDSLPAAVVGVSTYVIGPWTGSSLNPARTLAPAVLSGTYTDLGLYLLVIPLSALAAALIGMRRDPEPSAEEGRAGRSTGVAVDEPGDPA